ncbi:MAG: maleylpyruvate isomerase N-terminal domain-containing protein, partial [Actinobacteria bacterium]|nr:maleylpyruvate isomerase N-terminal domain-containing protein [Actinomycetota bacterium]
MPVAAEVDGVAVRAGVKSQATRLTDLLRSIDDGSVPALGRWDLADVTAHVSHTLDAITAMVRGAGSVLDDIWHLSTLSAVLVEGEGTRSLSGIAARIDTTVAELTAITDAMDGSEVRPWVVGGTQLTIVNLSCQALNELVVHGRD